MRRVRQLVLVLGDQLNLRSAAFNGFDRSQDVVWMAEVDEESSHVPSHKARTVMFLSAMRHFAEELHARKVEVHYSYLQTPGNTQSFAGEFKRAVDELKPEKLILVQPGEWRVLMQLKQAAAESGVPLEIRPDRHFFCQPAEFQAWAKQHPQLRMEFFYREMRMRTGILMENAKPAGGRWNFDKENRNPLGKQGPGLLPPPHSFPPDAITQTVMNEVNERYAGNPGCCDHFNFPVTAVQAQEALHDFIENRLPYFGAFQDAMWTNEPILYHTRLSAALNLKLLNPRQSLEAAETAYRQRHVSLEAAEGFVRQILGWREYVRGMYWMLMPEFQENNALEACRPLPDFYWTGNTEMNCLRHTIGQTLEFGYAHHIQRLMVNGTYALLFGVNPKEIHKWYLGVYVDAVEWVELPNVLGISQFADGGIMATKPYVATGKYISRMSNYCNGCRFDPNAATGENACPFTTFYWDFLLRHREMLAGNERMKWQVRNLNRLTEERKTEIQRHAEHLRTHPV